MILCVDSGNTRIKWGMRLGNGWHSLGALMQAEIDRLAGELAALPVPRQVMVANVAGPAVAQAITAACAAWGTIPEFVRPAAIGGGVANGYDLPERLGVDRWCALVGARQLLGCDCLVVGAGTATTIDTLDSDGNFLGGLILPGLTLMQSSLARNTADLPLARGEYRPLPKCTDDAIFSGCLEAQLGAIERAFARLSARPGALCLLFGGAAPRLAEHLSIPWRQVDTLVLDGLFYLAGQNQG